LRLCLFTLAYQDPVEPPIVTAVIKPQNLTYGTQSGQLYSVPESLMLEVIGLGG
jgi:hypothetical protein